MAKNTALFMVLALFAMALLIYAETNYDQYILGKRVYGYGSQAWREDHGYGSELRRDDYGYRSERGKDDHEYGSSSRKEDHGYRSDSGKDDQIYKSDSGKDDHGHGPHPGKDDNGYGAGPGIHGYPYGPIGRAVWPLPIGYWHHRVGPWWWLKDGKTAHGMAGAPTAP